MTRFFTVFLTSMAAVQTEDVRASLVFVGDLNGHHQELLGSKTVYRHCVAAFNFETVSSCDQLVVGSIHVRGGTLNLLMTNVNYLVRVAVVAHICNSNHSSLSAQAVPDLCVSRKVSLKKRINWNTVCCAMQDLRWLNIWSAVNPVDV